MMDGSPLLESLESLWFFTNVLSSTNSTKELEPPEPIRPIVQNQQRYDPPKVEFAKPRCLKCDEFSADEIEQDIVQPSITIEDHEVSRPAKKEEKERKRKSRKRRIRKRKIVGDLNYLGLDGNCHYKDYGFEASGNEKTWEHGMFGSQPQHHHHHQGIKMPPLNDGVAMKEHLKSWAYAVACTVR